MAYLKKKILKRISYATGHEPNLRTEIISI
jgi:hypothetical protein